MPNAFIIIQFNNTELDSVYENVYLPALVANGFEKATEIKRADKHDEGGMRVPEIKSYIEKADIIIADLTNERPNCYLEVGYAMGLNKYQNLILTAKLDHDPRRDGRRPDDKKVHFDTDAFGILYWDLADLPTFKAKLENRIRDRKRRLAATTVTTNLMTDEWWEAQLAKLPVFDISLGRVATGFRVDQSISKTNDQILDVMQHARYNVTESATFPVAHEYVSENQGKIRSRSDGILANFINPSLPWHQSWFLSRTGGFFLQESIFHGNSDETSERDILTEDILDHTWKCLIFCYRLYKQLKVSEDALIDMRVQYTGLHNSTLIPCQSWPRRHAKDVLRASEPQFEETQSVLLSDIKSRSRESVKKLSEPLFDIFGFYHPSDADYLTVIEKYRICLP